MTLICSKCGGEHDGTGYRSGRWCAPCTKAYQLEYYEKNKARLLPLQQARERVYRAKDPDAYRAKVRAAKEKRKREDPKGYADSFWRDNIKRRYGATPEDYDRMLAEQGGVCAICKGSHHLRRGRFSIDHCHTTGKIRALLCDGCNLGIGNMEENPSRLRAAADYLERHAKTT